MSLTQATLYFYINLNREYSVSVILTLSVMTRLYIDTIMLC